MTDVELAGVPVSQKSLQDARRRLCDLSDAIREDKGTVPAWLVAARLAISEALEEGTEHE